MCWGVVGFNSSYDGGDTFFEAVGADMKGNRTDFARLSCHGMHEEGYVLACQVTLIHLEEMKLSGHRARKVC